MDASLQYKLIMNDYGRSLTRVSTEKAVKKDTDYFWDNIGKVKNVDDFVSNTRLYTYAMKAFGLDDMTYAKGFMKKVLVGGVTDKDSFANKLSDERYRDFAKAFDFQGLDAQKATVTDDFKKSAPLFTNYNQVIANANAVSVLTTALGIPSPGADYVAGKDAAADNALIDQLQQKLPISKLANAGEVDQLIQKFNAGDTLGSSFDDKARQSVVTQYLQQTLETEVGEDNDGSRLALYFARKGKSITSYYDVLADPALLKVMQTALGLPDTTSAAPLDTQVRAFQAKFDVKDFSDPTKLDKFVRRFTAVWDATQSSATATSGALAILTNGASLSTDTTQSAASSTSISSLF